MREFELRTFFAAENDQSDSTDERNAAQYWRNRDAVLSVRRDVHGAYIHNVIAMGVAETVIGESKSAEDD